MVRTNAAQCALFDAAGVPAVVVAQPPEPDGRLLAALATDAGWAAVVALAELGSEEE